MKTWIQKTICASITLFIILAIIAVVNFPTYYLIDKPEMDNYVAEACPILSYTEQTFHGDTWNTLVYQSPSLGLNGTYTGWASPSYYVENCDNPNYCVKCCYLRSDPSGTFGLDCISLRDPGGAIIIYIVFNLCFGIIAEIALVIMGMYLCRHDEIHSEETQQPTKVNHKSDDVNRVEDTTQSENFDSYSLQEISTQPNNDDD